MDPPVVRESRSQQPVVSRGSTVLHPPGAIDRIAEFFGVRPSYVHTLTVRDEVPELYAAICSYSAQLGRAEQDSGVRLTISPNEPCVSGNCLSLRDFAFMSDGVVPDIEQDREGVRRILKFQLGMGEAVLFWPPPSGLRRGQCGVSKSERTVSSTVWPRKRSQLLYVVNHSFGIHGKQFHNAVLVASVDKSQLLQFSQGVLNWDEGQCRNDMYEMCRLRTGAGGSWWILDGENRARPADTIFLKPGLMNAIMDDVADFLSLDTRKWYSDHGVPHRRCFLFHGPPGTGKTSTISTVAARFGLACCYLSVTNLNFSNQLLTEAFSMLRPQSLLIIEDIDAMFTGRESQTSHSLSFSALLNALDGVVSAEGVITIMTTNHPERIDAALTRCGRVDRRFYFGNPRSAEIRCMFKSFYPDCEDDVAQTFAQAVEERSPDERAMSIATLQEVFIRLRKLSAEDFVKRVPSFFDDRRTAALGRTDYDCKSHGKLYM